MQKEVYNHISKKNNDPIVERKTCTVSGQEFPIFQSDLGFYDKISPIFGDKKYQIPTPTLSPEERQRRRLVFRNERKLYKSKCDFSGKSIVSMYSPDSNYKVYDQDVWRSDKWDPMSYGVEFDFNKTFTEQFNTLYHNVPLINLWNINPENSEYNNNSFNLKDSYLNFNSDFGENVFYSYVAEQCQHVVDCSYIYSSQHCYQSTDIRNSYNCFFSDNLIDSSYCYFSSDLISCNHCYGSNGLRNSQYMRNNEQKSKEERQILFETAKNKNYKSISKDGSGSTLQQNMRIINSENCIGNYIANSKNATFCFDVGESKDIKYVTYAVFGLKDVYDSNALGKVELGYECNEGGIGVKSCCFVKNAVEGLYKSFYSVLCGKGSSHLFGCIGLRAKEYCIFNKQYTKEQYELLVPKIIEHMQKTGERGEFFHSSLSPFAYNETLSQEHFPLNKKEATAKGYQRQSKEYSIDIPDGIKIVTGSELFSLKNNEILDVAIKCKISGKLFRIMKVELDFYQKHNISLPLEHPDIRYENRIKQRPKRDIHLRKCDKAGEEILSVYPPNSPFKVYSQKAYEQKIY